MPRKWLRRNPVYAWKRPQTECCDYLISAGPECSTRTAKGCNHGVALEIEWSQVSVRHATITFKAEQTKTGEARTVPLPDALMDMLRGVEPKEGKVFSGDNLRWSWNRACVAAGLGKFFPTGDPRHPRRYEGLTIHDLRRSALSNFRKQHLPEVVAMEFSGHTSRATFLRYNIVDDSGETRRDAQSRQRRHVGRFVGSRLRMSSKSFSFACPSGGTGRRASFRS